MNNSHLCICCFIINISTDISQCPLCWVLGEGLHEVTPCLQLNYPQVDSYFPIRAILPPPQAYFSSSLPHLNKQQPILPEAWIRVLEASLVPFPPTSRIQSLSGLVSPHQFSSDYCHLFLTGSPAFALYAIFIFQMQSDIAFERQTRLCHSAQPSPVVPHLPQS